MKGLNDSVYIVRGYFCKDKQKFQGKVDVSVNEKVEWNRTVTPKTLGTSCQFDIKRCLYIISIFKFF